MNKQRMLSLNVFLILAIWFNACPPASPGKLEIRVTNEKITTVSDMIVTGKNFTANKPVTISITNFPRSDGTITRNVTADASGNFTLRAEFGFVTVDRNEQFINMLITARDETTGQFVIENVSPEPYLIRR
jgi:hypothetical protein